MRGTILAAVMFAGAVAAGGCYTSADVGYTASYTTADPAPDLVEVSPGVQVVADYDEPVFFNDGFYWRYYNNGWYRSNNYYNGWYYYERPPVAVLRIDRPYAYSHYRPAGYVSRRGSTPYRRAEPVRREEYRRSEVVRDHREPYRAAPAAAPANREVVRDHREPEPAARRAPPPAAKDEHTRDHRH